MNEQPKWSVGQEVTIPRVSLAPNITTITKLSTRLGKVVTIVTANGRKWHGSGVARGSSYDHIVPTTPAHHEHARRERLTDRILGLYRGQFTGVPTEALEAFVAALDAAAKEEADR